MITSNRIVYLLAATMGCFAIDAAASVPTLYWSDASVSTTAFHRMNIDGSGPDSIQIQGGANDARGLAIDPRRGRMYWMNAGTSQFKSAKLDGSDVNNVVTGISDSAGPAIDVAAGKLYWCSGSNPAVVRRSNLDGTSPEDLVTNGLSRPLAIALDVPDGWMFWSDRGNDTIKRAHLDGSSMVPIATGLQGWVYGLNVDAIAGQIYWTVSPQSVGSTGSICRAQLDGTNVQTLFMNLEAPTVVVPDPGHGAVYWTESYFQQSPRVVRGDLSSQTTTVLVSGVGIPWGLASLRDESLNATGSVWVRVPDAPSLDLQGPLTIEAWIKSASNNGAIIEKWGDEIVDDRSYSIELQNGQVQFGLARDDNQTNSAFHSFLSGVVTLNEWHHIACTYDGAQRKTYVDGVLVGSRPTTGLIHIGSTDISIGAHLRNNTGSVIDYFSGMIDEVRIWSVARTQGQIQGTLNAKIAQPMVANCPGLVSVWSLDGSVADAHTANPGIAVGTVTYAPADDQPVLPRCGMSDSTIAYYRFEEGNDGQAASGSPSVLDVTTNSAGGTPLNGPTYRAATFAANVPQTQAGNDLCLEVGSGSDSVTFNGPFIFNASHGDATLEFWLLTLQAQIGESLIWGRGDGTDTNRFNLAINPGGVLSLEYRDLSGNPPHVLLAANGPLTAPINTWTHVAMRRIGSTYSFYRDGMLVYSAIDVAPSLPTSQVWTIAGRPSPSIPPHVRIDEIRFSNRALAPSEFLNASSCQCVVTNYCTATLNSTGAAALMNYSGSASVSQNNLILLCDHCPLNTIGVFFYGPQQAQVSFGNGYRCVAGPITRTGHVTAPNGTAALSLNYPTLSTPINPGATWNFQFWYRNPAGGGAGFNLSNGLSIRFCP